jgi:hypothetical protein
MGAFVELRRGRALPVNEKLSHIWDGPRIRDVHEELWARFVTELIEKDIEICHYLGDKNPSFDKIRYVCTTPLEDGQAWWTPPNPFDISEQSGYFQSTLVPKLSREYERAHWTWALKGSQEKRRVGDSGTTCARCHKPAHRGACRPPPKTVAPSDAPDSASEPEQEDKFGAKPKLLSLTKLEHHEVKKHMPKHQGKDVCLSLFTHDGCKLGDKCTNAHVTISRERQHSAVQLYFLSKHGHKSSTKMSNSEAQAAQRPPQRV